MGSFVYIGGAPTKESATPINAYDYVVKAKKECRQLIDLIRQKVGIEPKGAALCIKELEHAFGLYFEVVCEYEDSYVNAILYAHACEANCPVTWNDAARVHWELGT